MGKPRLEEQEQRDGPWQLNAETSAQAHREQYREGRKGKREKACGGETEGGRGHEDERVGCTSPLIENERWITPGVASEDHVANFVVKERSPRGKQQQRCPGQPAQGDQPGVRRAKHRCPLVQNTKQPLSQVLCRCRVVDRVVSRLEARDQCVDFRFL